SSSRFDPNQTSISTFKRDILIPRLVFNRTLEPELWSIRYWRVRSRRKPFEPNLFRGGDASFIVVTVSTGGNRGEHRLPGLGTAELFPLRALRSNPPEDALHT